MRQTQLIFIFGNNLSLTKVDAIKKEEHINYIYICDSLFTREQLILKGLQSHYLFNINDVIWNEILTTALRWLTNFPKITLSNNIQLADYFKFKNQSLWWFIYDALFEVAGGIFDSILYCTIYKYLLASNTPQNIVIIGNVQSIACSNLLRILEQTNYKIQILESTDKINVKKTLSQKFKHLLYNSLYWFDLLVIKKCLLGISSLLKSNSVHSRYTAFLCNHGNRSLLQFDNNNSLYITDNIYKEFEIKIRNINKNVKTISLFEPVLSNHSTLNKVKNWFFIIKGIYIPWYSSVSYSSIWKLFFKKKVFKKQISSLFQDINVQSNFMIDEFSFLKSCEHKILELLPGLLFSASLYIDIASRIVKNQHVDTLYTVESHSSIGRSLALALNTSNGKLIGLQGGIITPYIVTNTGFYLAHLQGTKIKYPLLPNEFHIWGNYYRTLLIDNYGYPNELIKISGNTNLLSVMSPNKKEWISNCKVILYIASSNIDVFPLIMTIDEELFTIVKLAETIPEHYILSIRLHPSHPIELFKNHLSSYKNIELHSAVTRSLSQDLDSSNIVITKASSVIFDALAQNKVLILVNFANTPDFTGIIKGRFWDLVATNCEELTQLLTVYLQPQNDDLACLELKSNMLLNQFVKTSSNSNIKLALPID
ncbi:hypothetical protein [Legionella bononiensis]|uniref:Capsule polysaccharide biosynthesis protein n=1 Tax=Legionella bononiensis TaxID=2793102 RepID=A0ABS1W7Z7_9GAMM|nr:hypothetical protein [Legionella bononiensis]MBL7480022.1 hypothetical protein [Legionella bononiensis]MBL7525464.1 hypothetical protein [Legionella bononiensis]MBL7561647.1 hypothetical protein [Legionella bononiensis]